MSEVAAAREKLASGAAAERPGSADGSEGASPGLSMEPLRLDELQGLATPAYVYDPAVVMARYSALREALGTRLVISFKANNLLDLMIRCAHRFCDGVELASIGELGVVTGRVAQRRFVNNPTMDDDFMRAALVSGCDFIVDDVSQAVRLATAAGSRRPRVLLRLNAASIGTRPVHSDHFGMDIDDAVQAARVLADAGMTIGGIHSFAGSQTFARHGADHARNVARAVETLEQRLGHDLVEVNLGGGFEADWESRIEELHRYRELLESLFGTRFDLAHEAGRGIYAAAGAFVVRAVAIKELEESHVVACDGGMAQNFLLAATEGMLRKHQCPRIVAANGQEARRLPDGSRILYVGSSCNRQDVIGRDLQPDRLPRLGDFCVFDRCGAYNGSYTVAGFLMLPPARNYLRATC